jgi:hypothetical protein
MKNMYCPVFEHVFHMCLINKKTHFIGKEGERKELRSIDTLQNNMCIFLRNNMSKKGENLIYY